MKKFLISFLFLSCISFNLYGWWDTGHMVVAKIAYQRLQPEVREEVDRLIYYFAPFFPQSPDFVTASCWPDDISRDGLKAFAEWHVYAYPYDHCQALSQKEIQTIIQSREGNNCIFAIEQCMDTLSNPQATDWTKALMLRFLLHIVGDIHQPLHCTTFYSKDFPEGDMVGSLFPIQWAGQEKNNLHAFWDSMCGLGFVRLKRPLDSEGEATIHLLVGELTSSYSEEYFPELSNSNLDQWREESYQLGCTVVYQGIKPNEALSESYIAIGQEVAKKRITLAGYRLAQLLNTALSSKTSMCAANNNR